MRLDFPNVTRPKKGAKTLAYLLERPLSQCQNAIAQAVGYKDWHELEQQVQPANRAVLDQDLSTDEYVLRQSEMALHISTLLSVSDDEAQFALAMARVSGDRLPSQLEQLAIRCQCLRRSSLPDRGRRQRGSVCKIKVKGWQRGPVILKRLDHSIRVITHDTPDAAVADFELVAPRKPLPLFIPMRLYLAYGVWTERDGSKVLFSRDYKPLWRIKPGEKPVRAQPWEWVKWEDQQWFWADASTPWSDVRRYQVELKRLEAWGIFGLPALVQILPHLVLRDDLTSIGAAVKFLQNASGQHRAA